jgi:predicted O-methyltransferase YrrM
VLVAFSLSKLLGARRVVPTLNAVPPDFRNHHPEPETKPAVAGESELPAMQDGESEPEKTPMVVSRPLQPIVNLYEPGEQFDISEAGLLAWKESPAFRRSYAFYRGYPHSSLQSNTARALLHHLIVMSRPERVLEIGTWHAGTTETLARALLETGQGALETIDPFGGERCPPIIAALPPELRDMITFRAEDSAKHFDRVLSSNAYYDLVLVDGNHEFEFALFDVMCAARTMRPGGIIVMDNIEQIGPRLAAKVFLDRHPDWQDVAGVIRQIDISAPFTLTAPSFEDTKFYVLRAPPYYVIRQEPRTFGPAEVDGAEVDEIELDLATPATGTLHILVHLRTFGLLEPEELSCQQSYVLDMSHPPADGRIRIPLRQSLRSAFRHGDLSRRIEISLSFSGESGLMLKSAPRPSPAKYRKVDIL